MDDQSPLAEVVLSAERASVSTAWVPRERVRIRREVITEEMTVTVTVRREVLRVEHELLPVERDAAGQLAGAVDSATAMATGESAAATTAATTTAAGPEVLEVLLSAERPVVSLEVVPHELVRLGVRSVATETPVTVDLRREVADVTTEPR